MSEIDLSYFKLSKSKLQETLKNEPLSQCLVAAIKYHQPTQHKLVLNLCAQSFPISILHPVIVALIDSGDISNSAQLDEAIALVKKHRNEFDQNVTLEFNEIESIVYAKLPLKDIKKTCGVGIVIKDEEIEIFIKNAIEKNKDATNLKPVILKAIRNDPLLKFGDMPAMIKVIDKYLKTFKPAKKETKQMTKEENPLQFLLEGDISKLHKAGENPQIKPELMSAHLKQTNGKVITRFPPEPNGFLHLGHAKAININFGYAELHKGICYLRYDDTNPEAEDQLYIDAIKDMVEWLGFKPYKVTHSSDHFQFLYECAIKMIKMGKAYVDFSTAQEMHDQRGGDAMGPRSESKYRNSSIELNLKEFEKMYNNQYLPGQATLRLKMDMFSPNPYFWDPVAYRINKHPHPRTNTKWCIYPTYDFTHCICDSLENITHSLCTTEFVHARESYYWLLDQLELYKPVQWEYGRLNVEGAITSKRKLAALIEDKTFDQFDDPRCFTLIGLRRRGVTPTSINTFVRQLGVTTSLTQIQTSRFNHVIRSELNATSYRISAVIDPLLVKLINVPSQSKVPSQLYIDASDYKDTTDPEFYRARPGGCVGLMQLEFSVTCIKLVDGVLHCRYDDPSLDNCGMGYDKCKSWIQWVDINKSIPVTINEYDHDPLILKVEIKHGYMSSDDLIPILKNINFENYTRCKPHEIASHDMYSCIELIKMQFMRIGYYQMDPSSDLSSLKKDVSSNSIKKCTFIVNKTVDLKEDNKKI